MSYPDALVFKIEEHDDSGIDTTMYIWHDDLTGCYYIRGKRGCLQGGKYEEYSFMCESVFHLVHFIEFTVDVCNDLSYTLLNSKNLPESSDDITFQFLVSEDCKSCEISGYDNIKFSKKRLLKIFRMMRGVHN